LDQKDVVQWVRDVVVEQVVVVVAVMVEVVDEVELVPKYSIVNMQKITTKP
jgi:hypothetical protein